MICKLSEYIEDAKSQLVCNQVAPTEYITYNYSNEIIDNNLDYFADCWKNDLSSYKALLFFYDYLQGDYKLT